MLSVSPPIGLGGTCPTQPTSPMIEESLSICQAWPRSCLRSFSLRGLREPFRGPGLSGMRGTYSRPKTQRWSWFPLGREFVSTLSFRRVGHANWALWRRPLPSPLPAVVFGREPSRGTFGIWWMTPFAPFARKSLTLRSTGFCIVRRWRAFVCKPWELLPWIGSECLPRKVAGAFGVLYIILGIYGVHLLISHCGKDSLSSRRGQQF